MKRRHLKLITYSLIASMTLQAAVPAYAAVPEEAGIETPEETESPVEEKKEEETEKETESSAEKEPEETKASGTEESRDLEEEESSEEDQKEEDTAEEDSTEETGADDGEGVIETVVSLAENAVEKAGELLSSAAEAVLEVTGSSKKTSYPEYGSDDFITWWFEDADDDEKAEWYESVSLYSSAATPSDAGYPQYDPDDPYNDDFWDYVYDPANGIAKYNEDDFEWEFDYKKLFNLIRHQTEEGALAATEEIFYVSYMGTSAVMLMSSSSGNLWDKWNVSLDLEGNGTADTPYEISSLENLMGLSEAVASGQLDTKGKYFELKADIDISDALSTIGHWNPIGWYQTTTEADNGKVPAHAFKGTFDGAGHTISGLDFINNSHNFQYLGLFGVIDGGTVKNLTIDDAFVCGYDYVGLLAGKITGESDIYNVTVSGTAYCGNAGTTSVGYSESGCAGGIAGCAAGTSSSSRVTIENCNADYVTVNALGDISKTGGIAGTASNAYIVDCEVVASSQRIQGQGYTGGITGSMSASNVYNSYVDGTIGGNGSLAAGGITGLYEGGQIILARMAGEIGNTFQQTAHEGIFIGTRAASTELAYGTEKTDNVAYLYTTEDNKGKAICGSLISQDLTVAESVHCGYWYENELKYTVKSGTNEKTDASRYFYEELEDGVRHIVINKLNRQFTVSDYSRGLPFSIDHYAPGPNGAPVLGYLLSVPEINALNANGTYDTDVATLVAYPRQNGSYYRTIDKDSAAAVAPGETVSVTTAAKNSGQSYYQMVVDQTEAGSVKPPTYTDEDGEPQPMTYVNGGGYTFVMPEHDTELNVEYIKVTTALTMDPESTEIHIVMMRSGDRKSPTVLVNVYDENNVLISTNKYGTPTMSDIDPVSVGAIHNGSSVGSDKTVKWSVDDADLITNVSDTGYTENRGLFKPNIDSSWLADIINTAVKDQADNGYKNAIKDTVYEKTAVATATTNPDTSSNNKAVYGNTDIKVTFQIQDSTVLWVEGIKLNSSDLNYSITRKLSGDREDPKEEWVWTGEKKLTATLVPDNPFNENVTWQADAVIKDAINTAAGGDHNRDNTVSVKLDPESKDNPSWIQNIINSDDDSWKASDEKSYKRTGSGSVSGILTVTSDDTNNGTSTADCKITLNFKTEDSTVWSRANISFDANGGTGSMAGQTIKNGNSTALNANAFTRYGYSFKNWNEKADGTGASYSDREAVSFFKNDETFGVKLYAQWTPNTYMVSFDRQGGSSGTGSVSAVFDSALSQIEKPYRSGYSFNGYFTETDGKGEKYYDQNGSAVRTMDIGDNVTLYASWTYVGSSSGGGGGSSGSSGGSTTSGTSVGSGVTGTTYNLPSFVVTGGTWVSDAAGRWVYTNKRTYADEWAAVANPYATGSQPKYSWFRFGPDAFMLTGWFTDGDGQVYYLNPVSDNTLGAMFTGWQFITDSEGKGAWYYFAKSGETGHSEGALYMNAVTPDGYTVNEKGQWVKDGAVVTVKDTDGSSKGTAETAEKEASSAAAAAVSATGNIASSVLSSSKAVQSYISEEGYLVVGTFGGVGPGAK